jgi:hypothetical protein
MDHERMVLPDLTHYAAQQVDMARQQVVVTASQQSQRKK